MPQQVDAAAELTANQTLSKVFWRLIPFVFLLYVLNILNRVNIGFARLRMLDDLEMSEGVFATGAGIFFVGYCLFQVPSNLVLNRIGARSWIGGIVVAWGLISSGMMFIRDPQSFYVLRFFLGIAQAGFFPGMILYLTYWIPASERAKAIASFMTASTIAGILGSPLSGALMQYLDQVAGLHGWQWLFLLEGLPTIALGCTVPFWLTDRPESARWLSEAQRTWLSDTLREEQRLLPQAPRLDLAAAVLDGRVWLLCALYFSLALGINTFVFYMPKLLDDSLSAPGSSPLLVGLLSAIPYALAAVSMVATSLHSDRTSERRWHVAWPAFIAAAAWAASNWVTWPGLYVVLLAVALAAAYSTLAPFWTLPNAFLGGTAAAGGIALINAVGNLGGYVGPELFSLVEQHTGSLSGGVLVLASSLLLAGALALATRGQRSSVPD